MPEITEILCQAESGDPSATKRLLEMVYDELRRLAVAKLAVEKPGQTLQPTALVHEAYIRLVDNKHVAAWNSRGHFFGAAAEAMRRIHARTRRPRGGRVGDELHVVFAGGAGETGVAAAAAQLGRDLAGAGIRVHDDRPIAASMEDVFIDRLAAPKTI